MRSTSIVARASLVGVTLVLLAAAPACGGGGGGGGDQPPPMGTWQDEMARAEPVYAAMAELAANFPEARGLEARACAQDPGWFSTLSWNTLAKITGGEPSYAQTKVSGVAMAADSSKLSYLTPRGETPKYPSAATYREAMDEFEERTHMGVVWLEQARAGQARTGQTFDGGAVTGWLVVFDLQTRQPVCQWPLEATSSDTLSYGMQVGTAASGDLEAKRSAIQEDLKSKLSAAISEAREKLKPDEAAPAPQ